VDTLVFEKAVGQHFYNLKFNNRATAIIAMILASIAVSLGGLIVRNFEYANPAQINIYRNLAFVIVIALIIMLKSRKLAISPKQFFSFPIICAASGLAITGVCIVQAYTHTLIANTVFIMSSVPFLTMILAYVLLKERVSRLTLLTIAISVSGIAVMIADAVGSGSGYGNFMALLAAVGFSIFVVATRAHNNLDLLPALMLAGILIVLVSLPATVSDLAINFHDLLLCILWGAIISGMAHWVFIVSARYIKATELTLFSLLETALAPIWVWWVFAETPGFWVLFGGVVIFFAVGVNIFIEIKRSSELC